jgi:hypothetical protein
LGSPNTRGKRRERRSSKPYNEQLFSYSIIPMQQHCDDVLSLWTQSLLDWTSLSSSDAGLLVHVGVGSEVLVRVDVRKEYSSAYRTLIGTGWEEMRDTKEQGGQGEREGYSQLLDDDCPDSDTRDTTTVRTENSTSENIQRQSIYVTGTVLSCDWRHPTVSCFSLHFKSICRVITDILAVLFLNHRFYNV